MIGKCWKMSLWLGMVVGGCWVVTLATAQPPYYDTRERTAALWTFEWQETLQVKVSSDFVKSINQMKLQRAQSLNTPPELIKQIDEKIANMVFELSAFCTIRRTPQLTHIHFLSQALLLDQAEVSDFFHSTETYFQGGTVITVHRDDTSGQIASVDIAECNDDVLGMGDPFGGLYPEKLIIYSGVSPFRLYGLKPENWRLVSVSPEEWVFENLHQPEGGVPKVRFHLDRRYQDALSRLEVRYSDEEVWIYRVLKYKKIENIWFPSEVEFIVQGGRQDVRSRAVLVRSERTKTIDIQIPGKTPVRDWRRLGRKAWEQAIEYEQTEWSEELLKSLHQPAKEPVASSKR